MSKPIVRDKIKRDPEKWEPVFGKDHAKKPSDAHEKGVQPQGETYPNLCPLGQRLRAA